MLYNNYKKAGCELTSFFEYYGGITGSSGRLRLYQSKHFAWPFVPQDSRLHQPRDFPDNILWKSVHNRCRRQDHEWSYSCSNRTLGIRRYHQQPNSICTSSFRFLWTADKSHRNRRKPFVSATALVNMANDRINTIVIAAKRFISFPPFSFAYR